VVVLLLLLLLLLLMLLLMLLLLLLLMLLLLLLLVLLVLLLLVVLVVGLLVVFDPLAKVVGDRAGHKRHDVERPPVGQQVAPGQPLHEVRLPVVLLGARGLARAAPAREGHVPALVLGVLQCRVVVLQDDLCEDAVFASSFALQGESGLFIG